MNKTPTVYSRQELNTHATHVVNTIENGHANDGEHTQSNNTVKSANYIFTKFLSASAWSSLSTPIISSENTACLSHS